MHVEHIKLVKLDLYCMRMGVGGGRGYHFKLISAVDWEVMFGGYFYVQTFPTMYVQLMYSIILGYFSAIIFVKVQVQVIFVILFLKSSEIYKMLFNISLIYLGI